MNETDLIELIEACSSNLLRQKFARTSACTVLGRLSCRIQLSSSCLCTQQELLANSYLCFLRNRRGRRVEIVLFFLPCLHLSYKDTKRTVAMLLMQWFVQIRLVPTVVTVAVTSWVYRSNFNQAKCKKKVSDISPRYIYIYIYGGPYGSISI